METHISSTESGHWNAHSFQRLCIQYIQATSTVHQNLSQLCTFDYWVDHQRLPPRGGYVRWVIGLVECDGSLRPLQITGRRRSDHVHFSVDDFQSTLALNISKNHQSGIHDVGLSIIVLFLILNFVRFFFLFFGLFLSELLDEEPTLSSGMFRVNEITLLIFFGVNVAW